MVKVQDLTKRELEVLQLVAENKSNTEIAQLLFVSVHTVKAHICSIIEKLSANGRTQAAVRALKMGLISFDENVEYIKTKY